MEPVEVIVEEGVLDVSPHGWGFLRRRADLTPAPDDIYISQALIRKFGLKPGDRVRGRVRAPRGSETYYGLLRVETVNGDEPHRTPQQPAPP
jgi:transcription termination factor Rho